ncbi:hypothetical protein SKAU_G00113200 [Synaphobranchus kaupii]|uniref:Uncharacterized protein n=1 Tax=Synaphobranchus kaupii TaxID=118154 RepID=A0A9Q1G141_SYNKA|nr:hypothetical protein SKAU_G00113200 [Synaphobranchus kaupii]
MPGHVRKVHRARETVSRERVGEKIEVKTDRMKGLRWLAHLEGNMTLAFKRSRRRGGQKGPYFTAVEADPQCTAAGVLWRCSCEEPLFHLSDFRVTEEEEHDKERE